MTIMLFILGVVLLVLLFVDVHMTVFVPRGGAGPIDRRIYRGGWWMWRWLGDRFFSGTRRRWWLAQLGPVLMPLTILTWGVLLVAAFTLLYTPWVAGFTVSPAKTGPMGDLAKLLYYSGYSAVTLGVGDVTPSATTPRILAFIEAGLGFALITAGISYLLSVYNARNQSTTLSLAISHLVGRPDGQDPIDLLARTATIGSAGDLSAWMEQVSLELATLVELIGQYPLLRYFHEPNDDRAIPLAMRDLMELTTMSRTLLDRQAYPSLTQGPSMQAVHRLGLHFLGEGAPGQSPEPEAVIAQRRGRYEEARSRLEKADVILRSDADAWHRFAEMTSAWDLQDDGMRAALGYHTEADED
ncbi:MAG TPA: potassium channel family protein [Thermomicrobiales bacterium]|nr:potassium channel family protein [Thermomicrobiales bacterium]